MKNYIVKNQITNKIIGESNYIEDATSIAIEYIKQHLNDMKRGKLSDINEISKIYIYKGNDGSGKQVYSQELQNFKASNNILTVSGENDNANIFFNNNDSEEKEENTSMDNMKDINYNAFNMDNNWDEVSTTLDDESKNNISIFNENYKNNISDDILRDYLNDVDKGYGYVTLSKMRDDLDYIYNIQLPESDVKELCNNNSNLCNISEIGGIEVILTKSAPSFDIIAKDLGLTEGVDYSTLDEEIQSDQKYPVKSPISESTQELTEKNWEYKIPINIIKDLADAVEVDNLNGKSEGLIKIYAWLKDNLPDDLYNEDNYESDEEYLSGLKVEYFEDEDELENEIDYAIEEFYDMCDNLGIWVPNYADIAIEDDNKELTEDTNINIENDRKDTSLRESKQYTISELISSSLNHFGSDLGYDIYNMDIEELVSKVIDDINNNYSLDYSFEPETNDMKEYSKWYDSIEAEVLKQLKNDQLKEDTNINIDKVEIDIDELDNEYNKVDDEASCYDCDDSFDYDRDELKNELLNDSKKEENFLNEKYHYHIVEIDNVGTPAEEYSEYDLTNLPLGTRVGLENMSGNIVNGYVLGPGYDETTVSVTFDEEDRFNDDIRAEEVWIGNIVTVYNDDFEYFEDEEDEDLDESLTDDQKYPIKSPISENVDEAEEKQDINYPSSVSKNDQNLYDTLMYYGITIKDVEKAKLWYDRAPSNSTNIEKISAFFDMDLGCDKAKIKEFKKWWEEEPKLAREIKDIAHYDFDKLISKMKKFGLNESVEFEKWDIGSDKSNLTPEEISKLKDLAKMLQDNSPNNWKYTVEKTYEDFGAGMQWYTVICYDNNGNDWQVLNTKEWLDLMNTGDVETTYNEVVNGKYFQDKKQNGKIDLWKWDI